MSNPKHDAEVMRTENDINGEEANNLYAGPSEPGPPYFNYVCYHVGVLSWSAKSAKMLT